MKKVEIFNKVKRQCKVRELIYEDELYMDEINDAINAVNRARRFTPTKDKLYPEQYSDLICRMAIYSIAKMGAEGQTSHSENGISRSYGNASQYPDELLNEVTPLVKT